MCCIVVATRITPGEPCRLSPDQDGGLMLRGTSGVPGHQAQSVKGVRGWVQVLCEFGDCL